MAKKMNWMKLERLLRDSGMRLFNPLELQRLAGVSAVAARFLIHRYVTQGGIIRRS
jgi:hypothetical protein